MHAQDPNATTEGSSQKDPIKLDEGIPHEDFSAHETPSGEAPSSKAQEQSLTPPQHLLPHTGDHNIEAAYSPEERQIGVPEGDGTVSDSLNGESEKIGEQQPPDRKQYTVEHDDTTTPSHSSAYGTVATKKSLALPEGPDTSGESQPKRHKPAQQSQDGYELDERTTGQGADSPVKGKEAPESGSGLTTYTGCLIDDEAACSTKAATSPSAPEPAGMYQNAWVLAPMVRISTLPFRLECLKYGAGKN